MEHGVGEKRFRRLLSTKGTRLLGAFSRASRGSRASASSMDEGSIKDSLEVFHEYTALDYQPDLAERARRVSSAKLLEENSLLLVASNAAIDKQRKAASRRNLT